MKIAVIFFVIYLKSFLLLGQDMIRMQYGDTIPSKVTEVGKKEIKYLKQNYLDGPVYNISKRKVVSIEHHSGEIEKINIDKRFRNYRAGISLSFGEDLGKIAATSYGYVRLVGIGHEGIFRIRGLDRFSLSYHLNLKIGEYNYMGEIPGGYGTTQAYFALPAVYTGIHFRQPIYKDFGIFASAQIGYMSAMFIDPKTDWFTSPYASYMVALGMYVREFKMSLRYNTGVIEVRNEIPQIIREGDYRLHMMEFVLTWEF